MYLLHKTLYLHYISLDEPIYAQGEHGQYKRLWCRLESYLAIDLLGSHKHIRFIVWRMSGGVLLLAWFYPFPLMPKGREGLGVFQEVENKSKGEIVGIMANVLYLMLMIQI